LLDALNQDAADYVDPKLTADTPVEVAIISSKTIRLKTDRGQEMPAIVDSQELLSKTEAPRKITDSRVVLLENSDFHDLEVQELAPWCIPSPAPPGFSIQRPLVLGLRAALADHQVLHWNSLGSWWIFTPNRSASRFCHMRLICSLVVPAGTLTTIS